MTDWSYTKIQAQQKTSIDLPPKSGFLQRTYTGGQRIIAGGEYEADHSARLSLSRSQRTLRSPSTRTLPQENAASVSSIHDGASHFCHDFSQIPVYSSHSSVLQAKLAVNRPGDVYEQEADQAAKQVMHMTDLSPSVSDDEDQTNPSLLLVQKGEPQANTASNNSSVPPIVNAVLNSGGGQPLNSSTRTFMEARLGYDFSRVRVHTGSPAAEAAQAVQARAFTVGQNIVLGAYEDTPGSSQYQQLIAHELVHTIQQRSAIPTHLRFKRELTRPTEAAEIEADTIANAVTSNGHFGDIYTAIQPGLIQRQKKGSEANQADQAKMKAAMDKFIKAKMQTKAGKWLVSRAKIVTAMDNLKAKFGLSDISEENGTTWNVSELSKVDAAFSKMSAAEQAKLKGVTLTRTDNLSLVHNGRTISVAAMTSSDGGRIWFTGKAFQANLVPSSTVTILHEAGHIIENRLLREAEENLHTSKVGTDLATARGKFGEAASKAPKRLSGTHEQQQSIQTFVTSMDQVTTAASDLLRGDEANLETHRTALLIAQTECDLNRRPVEQFQNEPVAKAWLEAHNRQGDWVKAIENWVDEKSKALGPRKNLTSFVDLVKKHRLARRSFAPFTKYVASFWPDKPDEFFAESFATWRTNPNYMKKNAKPLFDWFEKGGHLQ